MLISEVMERTPPMTAAENMADRLADRIRNIWLEHTGADVTAWEENFYEDPDGISFLRSESFPNLQGIDYIFKWWGAEENPEEAAGELEVLWKIRVGQQVHIYKTWIRMAERDFVLGIYSSESDKRSFTRTVFREAFSKWQRLYAEIAGNAE